MLAVFEEGKDNPNWWNGLQGDTNFEIAVLAVKNYSRYNGVLRLQRRFSIIPWVSCPVNTAERNENAPGFIPFTHHSY